MTAADDEKIKKITTAIDLFTKCTDKQWDKKIKKIIPEQTITVNNEEIKQICNYIYNSFVKVYVAPHEEYLQIMGLDDDFADWAKYKTDCAS